MPSEPDVPEPDAQPTDGAAPTSETPPGAVTNAAAPAAAAAPIVETVETSLSPAASAVRLAELFPALFVAPNTPGPFKPIKLRIHTDIMARAPGVFSKRALGIFFSRYTTTNGYLKALTASGAQRFDLDGLPAGEIAEEHRAAAVEELARRHAIAAERRAAQRQAAPRHAPAGDGAAAEGAPRPPPQSRQADRPREPRRDERHRDHHADAPRAPRPPRDAPPRPHFERARSAVDSATRDARRGPAHSPPPRREAAPPSPALPADPAQRERVMLLRAFESSPLSKANFCALKRISEADLDALLAQARTGMSPPKA